MLAMRVVRRGTVAGEASRRREEEGDEGWEEERELGVGEGREERD